MYRSLSKLGCNSVRDVTNTKTTTFINKSHNGCTCGIGEEEEEEYDSNEKNILTGSNTFENYTYCKCYGYHEAI